MSEKFINYNHGCNKSEFNAEEMVRVSIEMTDEIKLHCHCSECKQVHILDLSQDCDTSFRALLRGMMIRQQVITIPDEISDPKRLSEIDLLNYQINFRNELARFPDNLVGHKELQDDYEQILIERNKN